MKNYVVSINQRAVNDSLVRAEGCLAAVRKFVSAYNELKTEAAGMEETAEEMPVLTSALLQEYIQDPEKIEKAYLATIAVPELAGGFKVKLDTLDIEHADYDQAVAEAIRARYAINHQRADSRAFAVREQGTKVIISDSWKSDIEERHITKAESEEEKALHDAISEIQKIQADYEKATGNRLDLKEFEPQGFGSRRPELSDIYNRIRLKGYV